MLRAFLRARLAVFTQPTILTQNALTQPFGHPTIGKLHNLLPFLRGDHHVLVVEPNLVAHCWVQWALMIANGFVAGDSRNDFSGSEVRSMAAPKVKDFES